MKYRSWTPSVGWTFWAKRTTVHRTVRNRAPSPNSLFSGRNVDQTRESGGNRAYQTESNCTYSATKGIQGMQPVSTWIYQSALGFPRQPATVFSPFKLANRWLVDLKRAAFLEVLWSPSLAPIILRKLYLSIDFLGNCSRNEAQIRRRDSEKTHLSRSVAILVRFSVFLREFQFEVEEFTADGR